ncbi:uncharacterized protein VDAG_09208 [Verticillium dahliae VdLs.17]|uniref:BZIP domain-containing protein n=1 Tax=Verticillium dahliae (strain VdLs.17 / ATCC MYA-4575 / FGSC 10137) TaxID=498257 RepID=G2XFT4_VERDV|nr:uncharacterized protein VDAG_09208 [Verticillium dahliae VdLs.17]EGY18682.1 hypothetical protein VDAG_09208 [Verticillium dahliae VdLs.17]
MNQSTQALQKRLSEAIAEHGKKQEELNEILEFLETIDNADLDQMSGSASSARNRRRKAKTQTVRDEKDRYEKKRDDLEVAMARMLEKIYEIKEALNSEAH